MKKLIYSLIILSLTAFTMHKYYVSVTEIHIKPDKLEIIIRTFPDDIERVLTETYHSKADLSKRPTRELLKMYLLTHFSIDVDSMPVEYKFSGFTQEDEFYIILLEAKIPGNTKQISIKNTILQDLFDKQKNIVHFFYKRDKASFILIKEEPVAVYELTKKVANSN